MILISSKSVGMELVDVGDPADFHFDKTDFTQDAGTYDLDLSGIVPAGTFAVILSTAVCTVDPDLGKGIVFRKKGNTNWRQCFSNYANVTAKTNYLQGIVFVDGDRKIQYKTSDYAFWTLDVHVIGYWKI